MKKQPKTYMFYIGIIIFVIGLLLKFLIPESEGAMQSAPFVLTGFGAGIIGVGAAGIFRKKVFDKNPEKAKKYEIAEKDERNIRLRDRKSTRLNSSHVRISYAVFCLKKKKKKTKQTTH